jgi:1-acyl-sn-glycerol-3-phosphate acyltransferase
MRTLLTILALLVLTVVLGLVVIIGRLLGVADGPGSIYDRLPRWWARALLFTAGTRVVVHGEERTRTGEPRIFVSNHVSWFDVLALASRLQRFSFVAKAELMRVPVFGAAARAVNTVPIERDNRKAAFQSYEVATRKIKAGLSVVVFPEGTRGETYALRRFKKGPFVLAIAAGVPVVPTIVHGAIHVLPKGSLWARGGDVRIHCLEPSPTAGLGYEDREALSRTVHQRMAAALRELYGVESPPLEAEPLPEASAPRSASPSPEFLPIKH